jgi:N-acetylglutamate synthase-like GNAT family acetyltransferase
MLIRHAHTGDTGDIIELNRQLGYELEREDVASNLHMYERVQGFVFVAEQDGRVIGFISGVFIPLFHLRENMFRITALCVNEEDRETGVGKALIEKIEEICRKKECNYIEVTSGAHRKKEAHLFYEATGFTLYKGKRFTKRLESRLNP